MIFKKIVKGVKKIAKGVGKAVSGVFKGVNKIVGSKFGQIALMAGLAVFTAGAGAAAFGAMGTGWASALSSTPLVGSVFNAGAGFSAALGVGQAGAAASIAQTAGTQGALTGGLSAGQAASGLTGAAAGTGSAGLGGSGLINGVNAAAQGVNAASSAAGIGGSLGAGAAGAGTAASSLGSGLNLGASIASAGSTAAPGVAAGQALGGFAQSAGSGLLNVAKGVGGFAKSNPMAAYMLANTAQSAFTPDAIDIAREEDKRRRQNDWRYGVNNYSGESANIDYSDRLNELASYGRNFYGNGIINGARG